MKFVKVDQLPKIDRNRNLNEHKDLRKYLDAFMKRNIKVAKVTFRPDEYRTLQAAYICVRRSCVLNAYPISVHLRNGELYVVRKDM